MKSLRRLVCLLLALALAVTAAGCTGRSFYEALDETVKNIIRKMAVSQQLADENASQLRRIRGR